MVKTRAGEGEADDGCRLGGRNGGGHCLAAERFPRFVKRNDGVISK